MNTHNRKPSRRFAVIGAGGKTGRRVTQRLQSQGHSVRTLSRSTSPAFDWAQAHNWPAALQGIDALYVTYQPDLAVARAQEDIGQLIRCAKDSGVEHIVLLSGRGEAGAQQAEQVLITSGLSWNLVRASWFCQNFSESFMAQGILDGELCLPADTIREPFVDTDDIADVAVAALTRPALANRVFEVTGPELLTFAECVAEISRQTGRPIAYRTVAAEQWLQVLQQQGVPDDIRDLLKELFTEVLDGRNASLSTGVTEALQRPPTPFATYVRKTIDRGLWSPAVTD